MIHDDFKKMTLDEAIKRTEETAAKMEGPYSNSANASMHRQFAEWLKELKDYRLREGKDESY